MTEYDTNSFAYFPVSDAAMATGFYLTGAGEQSVPFNMTGKFPPHPDIYQFAWEHGRVLPEYQLVYLHTGAGEFKSNETGCLDINPGMALILMPDVWHSYRPRPGALWGGYWLSFNGEIPHIWQRSGAISPVTTVRPITNPQVVAARFEEIIRLALRTRIVAASSASFRALSLVAAILSDTASATSVVTTIAPAAPDDRLVRDAMDLIWNHSHRNLSVQSMAEQLHTTCRTLERRFLTTRKHGVLEELTQCRVSRAERMLRETHLPIKQIAYMTGFTSPTHLFRVFKRKLGTGPMEFRKLEGRSDWKRTWNS